MTTVIINEKSKEGKSLIEFLKNKTFATVIDNTSALKSMAKSIDELKKARSGQLKGKTARNLLSEL